MGKLDIIQWTDQSILNAHDNPKIYACFGLYPRLYTGNKFIYKGAMVSDDFEKPEMCVIKTRRFRPGTERYWQGEIDLNRYANEMAVAFTDQTLAAKIDLVDQYIAPLRGHTKWDKVCLKMKPNYFRKLLKFEIVLIENAIRNVKMLNKDKVLEAFSHFTYSESNEQNLLHSFKGCKIEDGKYLFLTPDMFTHKFDIHRWFQKHTCNNICGKFRRPTEASQPDKPLDVDTDAIYYNFDNDRKPVNEKENFSKEKQKESGEKHVNFETTFGGKSCDGTYSVVTAVVHSEIEGKSEPTTTFTQIDNSQFSGEHDLKNNNFNLNEYQADQFSENKSEPGCVPYDCLDGGGQTYNSENVIDIKQYGLNHQDSEDTYLQTALLARDENTLERASCEIEYDEPNANTEASTLVIRAAIPHCFPKMDDEIENLPLATENYNITEKKLCSSNYTECSESTFLQTTPFFETSYNDTEMCLEDGDDNITESIGPHNAESLPENSPEVQRKLDSQYHVQENLDDIEEITSHEQSEGLPTDNLNETHRYPNTQFKTQDNLECEIISQCDEQQLRSEEFITDFTADLRAEKIVLETSSSSSSSSLDLTPHLPTTQINDSYITDQVHVGDDSVSSSEIVYQDQCEPNSLYLKENTSDSNENAPKENQNVVCTSNYLPANDTADGTMINMAVTHGAYNHKQEEDEVNDNVISDHSVDTGEILERTDLRGLESTLSDEMQYSHASKQESLNIKEHLSDLDENNTQETQNVIFDYEVPTSNTIDEKTIELPKIHEHCNYAKTESKSTVHVIDVDVLVHSENSDSNAPSMFCEYSDSVILNPECDQQPQEHNEDSKNDISEITREKLRENPHRFDVSNAIESNEHHDILRDNHPVEKSESKMWSHPDFLVKYNLQNFVDDNKKSSDQIIQSCIPYNIEEQQSSYQIIQSCIPYNIEEQQKEIMVKLSSPNPVNESIDIIEPERIQKPLHSSLRSRKQKHCTKSVKFADDVKNDNFIEMQQTERIMLHKPPNGMSVISNIPKQQINPAVLEQCKTHVNLRDPNWYTHIPCECCDNENITGRD